MKVVEIVEEIIANMFLTELSALGLKWKDKCKIKRFKKGLTNDIREFINDHDGTILTTGEFERFLVYHHPIEYAFKNISVFVDCVSKEQFITNQLSQFWNLFPSTKDDYYNHAILKDLLTFIYDKIEAFYVTNLSKNERYLSGVVQRVEASLRFDIDKTADKTNKEINISTIKIEEKIDSSTAKIENELEGIYRILNNQQKLDKETVWQIFSTLSKSILQGNVDEVRIYIPLLSKNSSDLEKGIKYYIDLFNGNALEKNNLSAIETAIEDDRIYQDLAEKTIYLALVLKSDKLLDQVASRNSSLFEIKNNLANKKYDDFYAVKIHKKEGLSYIEYKLLQKYPDNEWLIKRICALNILEQPVANASIIALELLDDACLIDDVIIYAKKINEYASKNEIDENIEETIEIALNNIKKKINTIPKDIQSIFYVSYLRWGIIHSTKDAERIAIEIPDWLQQNQEIQMLLLAKNINKGIFDVDQIIDICNNTGQYWLVYNLLTSAMDSKPEKSLEMLKKYRYLIDKDPSLFLLYVELTYNIEGKDKTKLLLEEYEEKYSKYLKYWIVKLRYFYSENELNIVVKGWLNSEYEMLLNRDNSDFINLLIEHNKYPDVLQAILKIEKYQELTVQHLRIKAIALVKTKHEIEALDVFNKLFKDFEQNDKNAFYIMMLSINNNRIAPNSVVEYAIKSNNPDVLLVTAQYSEINNENDADYLIKKAMFRAEQSNGNISNIFGQYLAQYTKDDNNEETEIFIVNGDSVAHLRDNTGKESAFCIHKKHILPNDHYEWEGVIQIYEETAIRLGLMRKKLNDTVTIGNVEYRIFKIESLDSFLFRVAIGKLIQTGNAKMLTLQTNEEGLLDIDAFKEQFKQQVGETTGIKLWLERYRNLKEIPASIKLCSKYANVSYTQLIDLIIQDPTVFIREMNEHPNTKNGYVVSCASAISLKKIGFDLERVKDRVVVSSSLKQLVSNDAEFTIKNNNRDQVATIGIENDQLYFQETSDEIKQNNMFDAIKLKDYLSGVECIENRKDLPEINDGVIDVKEFIGIVDYDSLSIAKEENKILLASEIPLAVLAKIPAVGVETIGIAGFITNICSDFRDVLKYTDKLIDFRFLVPFNRDTVEFLSNQYLLSNENEKILMINSWREILLKPVEDDLYKRLLLPLIADVISGTKDRIDRTNPILVSLLWASLKYSDYSVSTELVVNKNYTKLTKEN